MLVFQIAVLVRPGPRCTQVVSLQDYYQLSARLRAQGFAEDRDAEAPICRWRSGPIILDVLPIEPRALGFGSEWYKPAVENAVAYRLPSNHRQKKFVPLSVPFFEARRFSGPTRTAILHTKSAF